MFKISDEKLEKYWNKFPSYCYKFELIAKDDT